MRSDAARVKKRLLAEGKLGEVDYARFPRDQLLAVDTDARGHVRLNFGRPLTWFTLPPLEAKALAVTIAVRAGAKKVEID